MKENLNEELDFVGGRKKVSWFTRDLAKNIDFRELIQNIQKKRKDSTIRTAIYSLFPLSEYVAFVHGFEIDFKNGEKVIIFVYGNKFKCTITFDVEKTRSIIK